MAPVGLARATENAVTSPDHSTRGSSMSGGRFARARRVTVGTLSACFGAPVALAARDRGGPARGLRGKRQLDGVGALTRDRPPAGATVPGTGTVPLPPPTASPSRGRSRFGVVHRTRDLGHVRATQSEPASTARRQPTPDGYEHSTTRGALLHDDSVPNIAPTRQTGASMFYVGLIWWPGSSFFRLVGVRRPRPRPSRWPVRGRVRRAWRRPVVGASRRCAARCPSRRRFARPGDGARPS